MQVNRHTVDAIFMHPTSVLFCRLINVDILFIGYRLNMAKYARPRSLSGIADRACEVCVRSQDRGRTYFAIFSL